MHRFRIRFNINLVAAIFKSVLVFLYLPIHEGAYGLAAQEKVDADFLLTGGSLHLGDGKPAIEGDLAIRNDRIVAVGKFPLGEIKNRIDCHGMIISPGFIDLHNHSDNPVTRKATRAVTNYLAQGCTTIVTGNCGSGPIDVKDYYSKLEKNGVGVNVAHLVPQGTLRRAVMQTERRSATGKELTSMKVLVEKAMQDGAWGMSTGLIYVPSSYADTRELIEVAKVVSKYKGIYVSHMRNEGTGLLTALDEALEIGASANIPVHVSHFKSSGKDSWGLVRVAVDRIQKAREAGRLVTADQYPYIASSTSLSATFIPTWARAGGRSSFLKRLNNDDDAKRIHNAIRKKLDLTDQGQRIQIANYSPKPSWAGRRLKEIADELKVSPFDLVLEIERKGGASIVNYGINESDVRYVMQQPWVATASDGASRLPSGEMPHPRSYGTFPRKIGYYSVREKVVPVEQAIRSSTGLPADILGFNDRGYLRVGYYADVAIWRQNELIDKATFESPHQYSDGVRYLFVNGKPAIWMGDVTGALLGRPLRHTGTKSDASKSSATKSGDQADSSSKPIRTIRFGSCIRQDKPMPIFKQINRNRSDLFIFLGDNIYADTNDISVMKKKYSLLAADSGFRQLKESTRVLATWDDHDYGKNDAGADYAKKSESQDAFLDFWNEPSDSTRRKTPGIYDAKVFGPTGNRVQVILLDTRFFRGRLKTGKRKTGGPYYPISDKSVEMLGDKQWDWLEQQLREPAEIRIIASSIQLIAESDGQETWSNIPHERERFFKLLKTTRAKGVIVISGDRHWSELSSYSKGLPYVLYDLTSSSLNQPHGRGTPTINRFRFSKETYHKENFGEITINWDGKNPAVSLAIRDIDGKARITHSIPISKLVPTETN